MFLDSKAKHGKNVLALVFCFHINIECSLGFLFNKIKLLPDFDTIE